MYEAALFNNKIAKIMMDKDKKQEMIFESTTMILAYFLFSLTINLALNFHFLPCLNSNPLSNILVFCFPPARYLTSLLPN
jgi:hypothetical protein